MRLDKQVKVISSQLEILGDLKTHIESVLEYTENEQIKELEQKSETFMKQQKSTENSFSLRLDEVMEQQKKLKDLEENFKAMESSCNEIEESNTTTKFDDNTIKSTERLVKILNVSSQVDTMFKELKLSKQHAFFQAHVSGRMHYQMDLKEGQIITSFGRVLNNIGNHYDLTKGIFTAPCDGLYLCSLTLSCEIEENVYFGIQIRDTNGTEYYKGGVQTTAIKSSASLTAHLFLDQNDQVYIASMRAYTQIKLDRLSYFMCALINRT